MLKPSNFITFTVPNFLQGMELNTPGLDNVQRSCEALKTQYQAIVPHLDLDALDDTVRSSAALFDLIATDRPSELSLLEWLLILGDGSIWQALPREQHAATAQRIWQFVQTQDQLIIPLLYALAQSSDRLQTIDQTTDSPNSDGDLPAFIMPQVLQDTILDGDTPANARLQDQIKLIRILIQKQYSNLFTLAYEFSELPRELFRHYGLPTQMQGLDRVEQAIVSWFQQDQSDDRCTWLLHGLNHFRPSTVHKMVSDLLNQVSPEAGSEHVALQRWLEQHYWYRSLIGRQRWDFLDEQAKENLPRWLSIGGWSDLKGAIELIQPQLPDWEQKQLKKRPQFWSHYTSQFDRVRILFCRESHERLTEAQQTLFECLEPSQFSEKTELCIFDFRTHYVIEILRGTISEMRIFPRSEELEELFFRSESLSLLQIRQQPCDLDSQVHDHQFLWQGYAERWLRSHGIRPNPGIKYWQGLPPNAAQYDPDRGLPEPSEDQKRDREPGLKLWWRRLRELQTQIRRSRNRSVSLPHKNQNPQNVSTIQAGNCVTP
jgi:hypothetical protein